jgi:kynurenine formamidase
MRRIGLGAIVVVAALTGSPAALSQARPDAAPATQAVTLAEYERWKTELSNWGRWGKEDELGALNLITPAKRRQAAALVKDGLSVSLAADANSEKAVDNSSPYEHAMNNASASGATDRIAVSFHGPGHTHLDAFAHRFAGGLMWNGFSHELVTMEGKALKNSVHTMKDGLFTRGILIDIPRLKGVAYLEPGTRILPGDLEAWERKAGVTVSSGDALFVRNGRWARRAKLGAWPIAQETAVLDPTVIPWLKKRDVALMGLESSDVPRAGELPPLAVHDFALIVLGIHLFDNVNLEAIAEAAAARNRWEFLLTAAPLPIPKGTGSPINPIATF